MYQQQQGQQQQNQASGSHLPEKDCLHAILNDLKRTSKEYATAVTEADNQGLRQVFTDLLNSTLSLQGQLYQSMRQNNQYDAPSQAQSQEIQKQTQKYQQSGQQAIQFAQQKATQAQNQSQNTFQPAWGNPSLSNANLGAGLQSANTQGNRSTTHQPTYM